MKNILLYDPHTCKTADLLIENLDLINLAINLRGY